MVLLAAMKDQRFGEPLPEQFCRQHTEEYWMNRYTEMFDDEFLIKERLEHASRLLNCPMVHVGSGLSIDLSVNLDVDEELM